jgi:hypothetical protein
MNAPAEEGAGMNTTLIPRLSRCGRGLLAGLLFGAWAGAGIAQAQTLAQSQAQPQAAPAAETPTQTPTQTPAAAQTEPGKASAPVPLRTSADGAYVLDAQNKLAWLRCAEGMSWNGQNCVGEPRLMSYATAQALASARSKADGVAWRLPRIHELRRIQEDAAYAMLFPGNPKTWTWSANASIAIAQTNPYNYGNIASGSSNRHEQLSARMGWAVHMGNGESRGDVSRRTELVVRLVRPYQP